MHLLSLVGDKKKKKEKTMKKKLVFCGIITFALMFCIPVLTQAQLPGEFTWTDPIGDVEPPCVDYVGGYFVQEGESLLVGFTMDGPFTDRIYGESLNSFTLDVDCDPTTGQYRGNECNVDFHDYGGGRWFGRMFLEWDQNISSFMTRSVMPATVTPDGKTMYWKFSLVGTGWEELEYYLDGWYKDGNSWHQVPHYGGDAMTEPGLFTVNPALVTQLVNKEGTNCIIEVPEPYSTTADAKNITGVVDEMVTLVRTNIGTIAESDRKFRVDYENYNNYASPVVYGSGGVNQFTCRIPGQYWVDEPNWYAMLEGVVDQTIKEKSAGLREVMLSQKSYQRPIPGYDEGWYCIDEDSINGFAWDAHHKWTLRALLADAYENCYVYYIAESMTDGAAKTAIMNKKADLVTAWNDFSGTAFDLTPDLMTGLLLSLSTDLSWTAKVFSDIIPAAFDLADSANSFSQIVNNYVRHADFSISSSDDFLTQAHHRWYQTITAVQTAAIDLAMGNDLFHELKSITDFPIDQQVYLDVKSLLIQDPYTVTTATYVWNDISTIGTEIPREDFTAPWASPDVDDGSAGPIALGMTFEFYDTEFDSIRIGINGQCSFSDPIDWITSGSYGTTIPGMGWDNILCPLACDIMGDKAYASAPYNTATGKIYYYHDATAGTFTVQYHKMTNHHYVTGEEGNTVCPDTNLTFQVVLNSADGSITYYYKDLGIAPEPCAKRATIGIQPGKDSGLGVQYYGDNLPLDGYPVNETAIKFYKPEVGIKEIAENLPTEFSLMQNFPNPFNPTTCITFNLPSRAQVSLVIYDMLGRSIASLVNNKVVESGYHKFYWDASTFSSGIYFYRLEVAGKSSLTKKCILLK